MRTPLLARRVTAQSLTELAMLMPLLALMLIGLIELGFLLQAHVQVSSAAREAARAASLYRSLRFATIPDSKLSNPPSCEGSIKGWSIQQVIEQAVVSRTPKASGGDAGCPNPSGAVTSSALGRLNPTRAPSNTALPTPCPTGNVSGWVVGISGNSPAYTQTAANPMPPAGGRGTLTLCYPHRLVVAAALFKIGNPVWINKSVVFEYQQ